MEHKHELEELNKQSLKKLEEYLRSKGTVLSSDQQKINTAKEKWQSAWDEFLETLLVLEKLEI